MISDGDRLPRKRTSRWKLLIVMALTLAAARGEGQHIFELLPEYRERPAIADTPYLASDADEMSWPGKVN